MDWYENLAPSVTTSWSTLELHFHIKWLQASLDLPLQKESMVIDAAPLIVAEPSVTCIVNANVNTATTKIPPHNVTVAPTTLKTMAMSVLSHHHQFQPDQRVN